MDHPSREMQPHRVRHLIPPPVQASTAAALLVVHPVDCCTHTHSLSLWTSLLLPPLQPRRTLQRASNDVLVQRPGPLSFD